MADMFLDALAELDAEIDAVERLRQDDRDAMGTAIKERADRLKTSRESVAPLDGTATSSAPVTTTDPGTATTDAPSAPAGTDPSTVTLPTDQTTTDTPDPSAVSTPDPTVAANPDDTGTAFQSG